HDQGLSASLTATVERGLRIGAAQYRAARQAQLEWRQAWGALLGDADLVLTPSAPGAAPAGLSHTGDAVFNKVWSVLGWPCVHLPVMTKPGTRLPVGVQLVGRFGQDMPFLSLAILVRDALPDLDAPRKAA